MKIPVAPEFLCGKTSDQYLLYQEKESLLMFLCGITSAQYLLFHEETSPRKRMRVERKQSDEKQLILDLAEPKSSSA